MQRVSWVTSLSKKHWYALVFDIFAHAFTRQGASLFGPIDGDF